MVDQAAVVDQVVCFDPVDFVDQIAEGSPFVVTDQVAPACLLVFVDLSVGFVLVVGPDFVVLLVQTNLTAQIAVAALAVETVLQLLDRLVFVLVYFVLVQIGFAQLAKLDQVALFAGLGQ